MDSPHKNYSFRAGDEILRVPFVVNVRGVEPADIDKLVDSMTDKLGAQHFREKDLFMDVLSDRTVRAADSQKWLYGPYIGVFIKDEGQVRISSSDSVLGGETVYSIEQYHALAEAVEGTLDVSSALRRTSLRP